MKLMRQDFYTEPLRSIETRTRSELARQQAVEPRNAASRATHVMLRRAKLDPFVK